MWFGTCIGEYKLKIVQDQAVERGYAEYVEGSITTDRIWRWK